ncbi:hypothetical protein [Blastococcus capsensis]|uniref:hypothetical protein n=1 Tax=Blastococcus capsensis TaxID=1564163 RepID=UPI0025417ADF|nr:hypothetical protein [Blastococcus capsensis]MDK3256119.1 hypothetical protein [Blastococcus capsensis]
MDVPPAAAWLVLGVVLGVLAAGAVVIGVVALLRRPGRTGHRPPATPIRAAPAPVDDLADFLEHPPGSRPGEPEPTGWATLALPPPPPPPPAPASGRGPGRVLLPLAAMCFAALTVVGTTAAVVAGTRTTDRVPPRIAEAPDEVPTRGDGEGSTVVGDLVIDGLVLEPRAVGITATYPEVRLRSEGGRAGLELRLPTYNCLTATPPPDPVAAGCAAALVEHATLGQSDLRVERRGDRLTVRGQVATVTRLAGSPPEPTGRVYELELTVAPRGEPTGDGTRQAVGELRIGTGTAPVVTGRSTLRPAD